MNTARRRVFAMLSVAVYPICIRAYAQNNLKRKLLPWPGDLRTLAAQAQQSGQPLVLMVSLPGCPFCEIVRRNYLLPMRESELSHERVAAFEFMVNDSAQRLLDFNGQRISPAAWSAVMRVSTTPTLLFFNAQGQEIAPRLVGVPSADFYEFELQTRLTQARQSLR